MDLGLLQPLQPGSRLISCIWYFEIHPSCVVYWHLVPFLLCRKIPLQSIFQTACGFRQLWNLTNYMAVRMLLWSGLQTYAFIFFVKICGIELSVLERTHVVCSRKMPQCLQRLYYAHKEYEKFLTAQLQSEHLVLGLQLPSTLIQMLEYCYMPFPLMIKIISFI